ncbi:unnamed protein product [Trichobilharzia regenti]|nr:unnamed protein product [Trichobilharzia regenti]
MNKDLIGSKNLGKVSRELEAMKRCQHPHIIRLYHVMETESNIFMVTEYASKGEVFGIHQQGLFTTLGDTIRSTPTPRTRRTYSLLTRQGGMLLLLTFRY